ncbi:Glycerol uptake facilitator protein [Penicillium taxi]|uniref:Glycerol uptake facilitator protein n=1 Tax=Penicillium taxi TaxID=168475 RepID=UPI002545B61E|nr:Glycerol uptake facilitator protein [Penicillium taxi]KAJ5908216.1 Glycerol uptake facilitator protein [Penicillium taxi]
MGENTEGPETPLEPIKEQPWDSSSNSSSLNVNAIDSHQLSKKKQETNPSFEPPSRRINPKEETQQPNSQHDYPSSHQDQPHTPLHTRAAVTRQPTESSSLYYPQPNRLPSFRNRTPSQQQQVNQWPTHSLAGSNTREKQQQGDVYIDDEYRRLNPRYGGGNENPIWGLAKPLPRVVRPGMRRNESQGRTACETEAPGQTQAAPEIGATPGLSPLQSNASQSQSQSQSYGPGHPSYASAAQQGIGRHHVVYAPQSDGILRPMESEVSEHDWQNEGTENGEIKRPPEDEFLNSWVRVRHHTKEPLAEWLATTVTILIGLSGTLAVSTGGTKAGGRLSDNWSWGVGSMIGIYLAGGISGAHLNPGISIALWIFRGFPGRRCCYYIIAQVLGAVTAAGLAYCLYRDAIVNLAPNVSAGATGLGFYTEPLSHVNSATAFFTEFVADAILVCVIFAMGDDSNAPPGAGMSAFVIGLVVYVLCICLGFNTGGCFNPVRDFGPRLVALMAGYGGITFTDHNGWWFWGCWLATIFGCLAGASLYDIFIFIGGESPINYAPRRRRRAKLKKQSKWRKRLGIGKEKLPVLEEGIKDLED